MDIKSLKYSEVDLDIVKNFLSIEKDFTRDDVHLYVCINGAKSLIESKTGKNSEFLDTNNMSVVVLLKTISDFYHNRLSSVSGIRETQLDPMFHELINQLTDLKAGGLM